MAARRLDQVLVEQGHYASRARAQAALRDGRVRLNGRVVDKPSLPVADGDNLSCDPDTRVSRAASKLEAALDAFALRPAGRVCLDIGASTGGFTQVLVARGASAVIAVDVGHGQLHATLREDSRVRVLEDTDARRLAREDVPRDCSFLTCDVSFIGAAKALVVPLGLLAADATAVVLVKPQFEVGPDHVGSGGIVRDRVAADEAVARFEAFLVAEGFSLIGRVDSPITGSDGNREVLVAARRGDG